MQQLFARNGVGQQLMCGLPFRLFSMHKLADVFDMQYSKYFESYHQRVLALSG